MRANISTAFKPFFFITILKKDSNCGSTLIASGFQAQLSFQLQGIIKWKANNIIPVNCRGAGSFQ